MPQADESSLSLGGCDNSSLRRRRLFDVAGDAADDDGEGEWGGCARPGVMHAEDILPCLDLSPIRTTPDPARISLLARLNAELRGFEVECESNDTGNVQPLHVDGGEALVFHAEDVQQSSDWIERRAAPDADVSPGPADALRGLEALSLNPTLRCATVHAAACMYAHRREGPRRVCAEPCR